MELVGALCQEKRERTKASEREREPHRSASSLSSAARLAKRKEREREREGGRWGGVLSAVVVLCLAVAAPNSGRLAASL